MTLDEDWKQEKTMTPPEGRARRYLDFFQTLNEGLSKTEKEKDCDAP